MPTHAPRRLLALLLTLLLAASLHACKKKEAPALDGDVHIGVAISSYVHAIAWIADDADLFGDLDDVEISVMGGSAATMRALLAGSIDVGLAGGDAVIKANLAGAELVILAGFVDRFYHRIVAPKTITDPEALRGKKVGLAFLGGPQHMATLHALDTWGMAPDDVQILNMGKEFDRMAALTRGDIHATTSQTPPSRLDALGLHVLADLPASDAPFPYMVLVTSRDTLERNPEALRDVLGGLCDAADLYRRDRDRSLQIIDDHLRGTDTEAAALERYTLAGPSLIASPPIPSKAGLERVIQGLDTPAARGLDTDALVDTTLLDALRDAGRCGGR